MKTQADLDKAQQADNRFRDEGEFQKRVYPATKAFMHLVQEGLTRDAFLFSSCDGS
jgi:hypothetical protein